MQAMYVPLANQNILSDIKLMKQHSKLTIVAAPTFT